EVLAPAGGTVVTVIDGVPDNRPGTVNPDSGAGNSVTIYHAPNQFSSFFHLQPHSITVKVGDVVTAGQAIGRCGNSGNSSNPHLPFHLMNSNVPQDATGIAPYFQNVRVSRDGKTRDEKDYTPLRGDRVQSIPTVAETQAN